VPCRPTLLCIPVFLFITACATLPEPAETPEIGPYRSISARLIVREPTRRWQVMLDWRADSPVSGQARLAHAASSAVVELRWQRDNIRLRDSRSPLWRRVSTAQLAEHGIIIPPYTLSGFLTGQLPAGFRKTGMNTWESRHDGNLLRVLWNGETRHLDISDIRHGRSATLIILTGERTLPVSSPAAPGKSAADPTANNHPHD